jgi:hypothetical protein
MVMIMQQSAMIKAIKHSLKDDFQQKTISHRHIICQISLAF